MMIVKLTRMRAVLTLTLLALTGAAWWAWEQVSRPWGAQAVSFKPAEQECGQEGQLRYCVHRAAGGVNGDVVYHLHGRNLEAEVWNDPTYFTALLQAYWQNAGLLPPTVVSLSYGPVWLLAPKGQAGGSGTFSGAGLSYTLDFGTLFTDPSDPNAPSGTLLSTLVLGNAATGPADALAGSWNLAALSSGPFSVAGFSAFTGLAAGSQLAGLTVNFNLANEGSFSRTLVLNSFSTNGSGPDLALGAVTLELQGTVVAVPEPGTYLMMAVGVLAMGSIARRKLRAQRG